MNSRLIWILVVFCAIATSAVVILIKARKKPLGYALEYTPSSPGTQPVFRDLNEPDIARLNRQRSVVINAIARLHLGVSLHGDRADLPLLQELIDKRAFARDQTYELQSLGIAYGDVLAKELGLHWAMITDEYGTDPTLQDGERAININALTMISKRVEEGREINLTALLEMNRATISDLRNRVN